MSDSPLPLSSALGKKYFKEFNYYIEMSMKMPFTVSGEQDGNI